MREASIREQQGKDRRPVGACEENGESSSTAGEGGCGLG